MFLRNCYCHLQGRFPKTLVNIYQTKRHQITEDSNIHSLHCENSQVPQWVRCLKCCKSDTMGMSPCESPATGMTLENWSQMYALSKSDHCITTWELKEYVGYWKTRCITQEPRQTDRLTVGRNSFTHSLTHSERD
jgi:hypothetical protein